VSFAALHFFVVEPEHPDTGSVYSAVNFPDAFFADENVPFTVTMVALNFPFLMGTAGLNLDDVSAFTLPEQFANWIFHSTFALVILLPAFTDREMSLPCAVSPSTCRYMCPPGRRISGRAFQQAAVSQSALVQALRTRARVPLDPGSPWATLRA